MEQNRWRKIEEIFNKAASLPVDERQAFIEDACREDKELCREVSILIENDSQENNFLDEPVFDLGAKLLDSDFIELLKTDDFAGYKLKKLIGRGGMGAVFLAEDTRLGRDVAVKVLPEAITEKTISIQRFHQEARAASNVSHPNIAHIYEFSQHHEHYFLAMEYVRGRTLRELIKQNSIAAPQALNFAIQIASALQAAHRSGVIHRDIKPENIIVTDDGLVKILDFGLAKLNETASEKTGVSSLETIPGMIIGTTAYMSPEQARGQSLDETTDLWSLGVVLYEMLLGERPFQGETNSDLQAAILKDKMPNLPDALPEELQTVITKSLAKTKSARYQTAGDFLSDLKEIEPQSLQEIDVAAKENKKTSAKSFNYTKDKKTSRTNPAHITKAEKPKFSYLWIIAVIVLSTAIIGGFYFFNRDYSTQNFPSQWNITRLTGRGNAVQAAISPSGKFVSYALEQITGDTGLFIRPVKAAEETILVAPDKSEFSGVSFSPDNKYVYYSMKSADEVIASLYRISIEGGNSEFVIKDIDSAAAFSPDGKEFAFLRIDSDGRFEDICIARSDGTGERVLYRRQMPDFIPHQAQPVWSSDGQKIIVSAGANNSGLKENGLIAIRLSDGQIEPIINFNFAQISKTDWFDHKKAIIMSARQNETQDYRQLWRVNYPTGQAQPITNDFYDYSVISVDENGDKLVTLAGERNAQLWTIETIENSNSIRQVSVGIDDSNGVDWTTDNKIVYSSNARGRFEIWIMNADGSNKRQLTDDEYINSEPAASPDGKTIAFVSTRTGNRHIWLMDTNGQNQRQLTNGTGESTPIFTPDGKNIIYYTYNEGIGSLNQISTETGASKVLLTGTPRFPAVSPDGKWLLSSYRPEGETVNKIAVVPFAEPTRAPRVFEPLKGASSPGVLRWMPDSRAFGYIVTKDGASNIYKQTLDESQPVRISSFSDERIYWFDFSPDGKQIVASRGNKKSFVMLFEAN